MGPPREPAPLFFTWEDSPQEDGPWPCPSEAGGAGGRFPAAALPVPRPWDATLSSGSSSLLERACVKRTLLRERAVSLASQTDGLTCPLREQWLAPAAKGHRARRGSRLRRLLPAPASVERKPVVGGSMRWVEVAGRALRRSWTAHWRRQDVELLPLVQTQQQVLPPPRPPRAIRSHRPWRGPDRLARTAWLGPPPLRVSEAFVPACLATKERERRRNWPPKKLFHGRALSLSRGSAGRGSCVSFPQNLPFFSRGFLTTY